MPTNKELERDVRKLTEVVEDLTEIVEGALSKEEDEESHFDEDGYDDEGVHWSDYSDFDEDGIDEDGDNWEDW